MPFWLLTTICFILIYENIAAKYYYRGANNGYDVYYGSTSRMGYKEFKSPKSYKVNYENRGDRPGKCFKGEFHCERPFAIKDTIFFECEVDYQCPRFYKCCRNECFQHKICQPIDYENYDYDEIFTSSEPTENTVEVTTATPTETVSVTTEFIESNSVNTVTFKSTSEESSSTDIILQTSTPMTTLKNEETLSTTSYDFTDTTEENTIATQSTDKTRSITVTSESIVPTTQSTILESDTVVPTTVKTESSSAQSTTEKQNTVTATKEMTTELENKVSFHSTSTETETTVSPFETTFPVTYTTTENQQTYTSHSSTRIPNEKNKSTTENTSDLDLTTKMISQENEKHTTYTLQTTTLSIDTSNTLNIIETSVSPYKTTLSILTTTTLETEYPETKTVSSVSSTLEAENSSAASSKITTTESNGFTISTTNQYSTGTTATFSKQITLPTTFSTLYTTVTNNMPHITVPESINTEPTTLLNEYATTKTENVSLSDTTLSRTNSIIEGESTEATMASPVTNTQNFTTAKYFPSTAYTISDKTSASTRSDKPKDLTTQVSTLFTPVTESPVTGSTYYSTIISTLQPQSTKMTSSELPLEYSKITVLFSSPSTEKEPTFSTNNVTSDDEELTFSGDAELITTDSEFKSYTTKSGAVDTTLHDADDEDLSFSGDGISDNNLINESTTLVSYSESKTDKDFIFNEESQSQQETTKSSIELNVSSTLQMNITQSENNTLQDDSSTYDFTSEIQTSKTTQLTPINTSTTAVQNNNYPTTLRESTFLPSKTTTLDDEDFGDIFSGDGNDTDHPIFTELVTAPQKNTEEENFINYSGSTLKSTTDNTLSSAESKYSTDKIVSDLAGLSSTTTSVLEKIQTTIIDTDDEDLSFSGDGDEQQWIREDGSPKAPKSTREPVYTATQFNGLSGSISSKAPVTNNIMSATTMLPIRSESTLSIPSAKESTVNHQITTQIPDRITNIIGTLNGTLYSKEVPAVDTNTIVEVEN